MKSVPMREKLKNRKCAICKKKGCIGATHLKAYCSIECQAKLGLKLLEQKRKQESKEKNAELKERKRKLNETVPYWTKKAQTAFNRYIRLRDHDLPCVSCGKHEREITHNNSGGVWDCGHYRSVGSAPALRFEESNAHKQCKHCNQFLSGNCVEYRNSLISRLSPDKLLWLEGPHEPKRYRVEDLKAIEKEYKAKAKEIEEMHKLSS